MSKVLVVAPHPDDEVFGPGGTILKHLDKDDAVHVVICTRGEYERFGKQQVETVQTEARKVHDFLQITGSHFLDLPAARLDTVPATDVNAALSCVFEAVEPDILYLPHAGDIHVDHRIIFQAAMVCSRPNGDRNPRRILAYETVSETDWFAPPMTPAFVPNVFVDTSNYIDKKLEACALYTSQIKPAPHQRSLEALKALSVTRGHAMGIPNAEAFALIREIV